ncbi:MAG: tetraacyldisaccharide 4'-kinase [Polaribacter sp.]
MKFIRFLLFPFAVLYDVITRIRNWGYDIQLFKSTKFDIPIIAVGNLSVGGTGKTPQVEYLVELLQQDYKLAILSRGYRRKTKGYVVADYSKTADDVGDEPFQYFLKFPNVSVAVCESRVEGIRNLQSQKKPDIILLDDAFQHRKVAPSFSVLLTKYQDLFIHDFLLPTGNLRESQSGAHRSDVIIVTKTAPDITDDEKKLISKQLARFKKPIFFSRITYDDKLKGASNLPIQKLTNYKVLLLTGIANPEPLVNYLKDQNINCKHLDYPDHHNFTDKDLSDIRSVFEAISAEKKLILTTEKDFVRLNGKIEGLSYLSIKSSFLNAEEQVSFNAKIYRSINF